MGLGGGWGKGEGLHTRDREAMGAEENDEHQVGGRIMRGGEGSIDFARDLRHL